MASSSPRIFRQAAVDHHRQRLYGAVLFPSSPSLNALVLLVIAAVLGGATLLSVGSYPRREHVRGHLVPTAGVSKLHASQPGVVIEQHVNEGDLVEQGQALLAIAGAERLADGEEARAVQLASLDTQIRETQARLALVDDQNIQRRAELVAGQGHLKRKLATAREQSDVQRKLVAVATRRHSAHQQLHQEGLASQLDVEREHAALLEVRGNERRLAKQVVQLEGERESLRHQLMQLPLDASDRMAALRIQVARLQEQRAESELEGGYTVTAPISGRVSSLIVSKGESVNTRSVLLSIVPSDHGLMAHLFVPTNAIGFVDSGMQVNIMVDAFPYQRFGTQGGRVTRVSRTVLLPAEQPKLGAEPQSAYRVLAQLEGGEFEAYGTAHALRPGMQLSADIVLERRTLFEWLFEPVFAFGRRG